MIEILMLIGVGVFLTTLDSVSDAPNEDADGDAVTDPDTDSPMPTESPNNDAVVAAEFADQAPDFLSDGQLENLTVAEGPLSVDTGDGNDLIIGSSQDDIVESGSGNDVVLGGDGDDQITLSAGNDLYGLTSIDPILGNVDLGDDSVQGGLGDDTLIDFFGSNILLGQGGNDIINAIDADSETETTPDQVSGGIGDDALFIDSGDTAETGAGTDSVQAVVAGDGSTNMITITDFSLLSDGLSLQGLSEDDVVTIQDTSEDPDVDNQATIFVNGNPVIEVIGGRGLTVEDIVVIP